MARVCVIRQDAFPLDPRVRREVDALLVAGHEVDVICVRDDREPLRDRYRRARVLRIPIGHRRTGVARHLLEYAAFLIAAAVLAGALHLRRRYDLVQVHSLPDPLVFAALVPRLLGARVLLDLHECMPEFFLTKFGRGADHPGYRLLVWLEQASIRFADLAITCTVQMREAFEARGAPSEKLEVVMNSSDETVFDPHRHPHRERQLDGFVIVSHGVVEERYGLDTAITAISILKDELPDLTLQIYGEGSYAEELKQLARRLGVEQQVSFSDGWVPLEELVEGISRADAGLVAIKRDAFRDLTHCNKMFDFIAMRTPAIVSRTRSVEECFDESCFKLFESDHADDLARAIRELRAEPDGATAMAERAAQVAAPYGWIRQRETYQEVVRRLLPGAAPGRARRDGNLAREARTGAGVGRSDASD